jgi:alkylation response protein AidB-like acyl-CoA dehydrogenase
MTYYHAPRDDFRFLFEDYLPLKQHVQVQGFADITELAIPIIEEGAKLCEQVLHPLNQTGDAEGCHFADGAVRMPKGFKEAYQHYVEGGWASITCNPEYGGQGLPEVLNMPMTEMICSANLAFGLTPGLSHSAYNLLETYLTPEMKARYLPKLISGEWTGVMCLTEPQAGTDLGLIRTKATPQSEGVYALEGTKIFISSGEHDLSENIVHLVLARLPDAPKGTKGISLFLVSKYVVNDDGSLGERNKVACASIEEKMGIHASSTCVMNYDGAVGYLVGEPHKGLRAMFMMMNAARLYVGVQGLGISEIAYQNALIYAKERLQGRSLSGVSNPTTPADPIIHHPDIRKTLLSMRACVEAGRALVLEVALAYDLSKRHTDAAVREEAEDFVQLMTPIVKAFLTDLGHEHANAAMQCFGGYGYIKEYGIEQLARDARITQIYEGTNAIQALDLVGRKLPHQMGKYLGALFHPIEAFIAEHTDNAAMKEFITPLQKHTEYLRKASLWLAKEGIAHPNQAAAGATEYLRMCGLISFAFIWAKQAAIAQAKIADGQNTSFYEQKLATARFYMARVLPQTLSLLALITGGSDTIMKAEF